MNTPYVRRTALAMAAGLLSLASITFTPTNAVGAQPHVHTCSTDCGYYSNAELRESGNYLGPATSNAHSGNVYEY